MAQDIRDLFKNESVKHEEMPKHHEARFLDKLEEVFPQEKSKPRFGWLSIAASIILLMGLSFGAFKLMQPNVDIDNELASTETVKTKTLGDVSPELKKVEDYYLASINLELSKIKPTANTKAMFDGFLEQLNELNKEYQTLSEELTENGVTELTINALIDNLRYRLDLLYRLRDQIKILDASDETEIKDTASI